MATRFPHGAGDKAASASGQPSRWKRNLLILVLLALGAWLGWAWQGLREEAMAGAAYGARVGCVCRYVSQRTIGSCEGDLKAAELRGAARLVSLSENPATRTVRASVPLLASQSADFRPERGCQLEAWRD
ncbi:hypothetical protein WSK_2241 [Novosphingobium sp. Rr 2-17]|uniref:hypothetical protein n=1 Tax=Novosphingobium sp. Rr 2-17 TaxID=555793 RepID=UPI0002699879|nr:hypothetical protein [Novosphingobium sp. Rr 2-17]EIZ79054.1 hypothetical protein WSK_2241 [Novosphingobium sp. Rr 2-17]